MSYLAECATESIFVPRDRKDVCTAASEVTKSRRKAWGFRILSLAGITSCCVSAAVAQYWGPLTPSLTVSPTNPTSADSIQLFVDTGIRCFPSSLGDGFQVVISGTNINATYQGS